MTRCTLSLFCSLLCAAVLPAAGQNNSLVLDAHNGSLIVSGQAATLASTTQIQEPASTAVLDLLDLNSGLFVGSSCPLAAGYTVHLQSGGQDYLTVVYASAGSSFTFTATTLQGTFAATDPAADGYLSFQLNGYTPGTGIVVTASDSSTPCPGFPSVSAGSFMGQYLLWIHPNGAGPQTETVQQLQRRLDDDPPVPISGSSLKLYAPPGLNFNKPCGPTSATLAGVAALSELDRNTTLLGKAVPIITHLDALSNLKLTAYPQQLEITLGWGSKLNFSVPSWNVLVCGSDAGGNYLKVQNDTPRPQQFVLSWGWFRSSSLPVQCHWDKSAEGVCRLVVRIKKK